MSDCPVCGGEDVRVSASGAHWFCPRCLGAQPDSQPVRATAGARAAVALMAAALWKGRAERRRRKCRELADALDAADARIAELEAEVERLTVQRLNVGCGGAN